MHFSSLSRSNVGLTRYGQSVGYLSPRNQTPDRLGKSEPLVCRVINRMALGTYVALAASRKIEFAQGDFGIGV